MSKYLIWSNEHRMWWKPDSRGYTSYIEEAGRYSRKKAEKIVSDANVNTLDNGYSYEQMVMAPESQTTKDFDLHEALTRKIVEIIYDNESELIKLRDFAESIEGTTTITTKVVVSKGPLKDDMISLSLSINDDGTDND